MSPRELILTSLARPDWFSLLAGVLALGVIAAASGCGRPSETVPGPTDAATPTPFEKTIDLWAAGEHDAAVDAFLELDCHGQPQLFSKGSVLAYSEREFTELPQADRDSASQQMLDDVQALKALCARVSTIEENARAAGDRNRADKCDQQVRAVGELLDQPNSLALLQLVGKSLKKETGP